MQAEDAESRADLAAAEAKGLRGLNQKLAQDYAAMLLLEQAKQDPEKRAEFEKLFPDDKHLLGPHK